MADLIPQIVTATAFAVGVTELVERLRNAATGSGWNT